LGRFAPYVRSAALFAVRTTPAASSVPAQQFDSETPGDPSRAARAPARQFSSGVGRHPGCTCYFIRSGQADARPPCAGRSSVFFGVCVIRGCLRLAVPAAHHAGDVVLAWWIPFAPTGQLQNSATVVPLFPSSLAHLQKRVRAKPHISLSDPLTHSLQARCPETRSPPTVSKCTANPKDQQETPSTSRGRTTLWFRSGRLTRLAGGAPFRPLFCPSSKLVRDRSIPSKTNHPHPQLPTPNGAVNCSGKSPEQNNNRELTFVKPR